MTKLICKPIILKLGFKSEVKGLIEYKARWVTIQIRPPPLKKKNKKNHKIDFSLVSNRWREKLSFYWIVQIHSV